MPACSSRLPSPGCWPVALMRSRPHEPLCRKLCMCHWCGHCCRAPGLSTSVRNFGRAIAGRRNRPHVTLNLFLRQVAGADDGGGSPPSCQPVRHSGGGFGPSPGALCYRDGATAAASPRPPGPGSGVLPPCSHLRSLPSFSPRRLTSPHPGPGSGTSPHPRGPVQRLLLGLLRPLLHVQPCMQPKLH